MLTYTDTMTYDEARALASRLTADGLVGVEAIDLAGGFYGVTVPVTEGLDALVTAYAGTHEVEDDHGDIIDVAADTLDVIVTLGDGDGAIEASQQWRECHATAVIATVRDMIADALRAFGH